MILNFNQNAFQDVEEFRKKIFFRLTKILKKNLIKKH